MSEPLIIGHRGIGEGEGENTLEAIQRAADKGADAVEIDVRLARDGAVVLMHDETPLRTHGTSDPIASLGTAELAALGVPRLEDVMALCRARELQLNVELKRDVPDRRALVERAAQLLGRPHFSEPRVWVSSFDPWMLALLKRLAPGVITALLVAPVAWRRHVALLARPVGASAIHPHFSLVTAERVARWRQRGLAVYAWTVNDGDEAERLLGLGVDGLITDDVAAMLELTGRTRTPLERLRA